jgi:hypothetical protein
MTSLGTDFERHAIWQGYVEDPAAKDFVARNACTIALSEAQGTWQSTLFMSLDIPWGFLTQAVLRSLAGLMSRKKVSVGGFLWVRKVWFAFVQWMFAWETFGKRRKSVLLRETHAFCARNMGVHVRCTSSECQRYERRDGKSDSRAAEKGAKKFVISDFAKKLE